MKRHHIFTAASVGAICAMAGATAGIAESSATTEHHATTTAASAWTGPFGHGFGGFATIHSIAIEANPNGSFETVTSDTGTITALGSDSLTIKEGSTTATYATPTITPTKRKLTVILNGRTSRFAALAVGDRVAIFQSSAATCTIIATDSSASSTPNWPGDGGNWPAGHGYRPGGWSGAGNPAARGYRSGGGWAATGGPAWFGTAG